MRVYYLLKSMRKHIIRYTYHHTTSSKHTFFFLKRKGTHVTLTHYNRVQHISIMLDCDVCSQLSIIITGDPHVERHII